MLPETQAQIFLSDQRLALHNPDALNFHTLLSGQAVGRPVGLKSIADSRLKAESSLLVEADEEGTVVLIPWIGDLQLTGPYEKQLLLEEGQVHLVPLTQGTCYELCNPYSDEAINFFQLWFAGASTVPGKVFPIALDNHPNRLRPIYIGSHSLLIGAFEGRSEGLYQPTSPGSLIFFYAIEGAFEVQNRLIQPRDGLALWNVEEVEFEALSEGAVLLVFNE